MTVVDNPHSLYHLTYTYAVEELHVYGCTCRTPLESASKHDILRHTIPWEEARRISSFIFLIQKIYSIAVQSLLSMCILELNFLLLTELTVIISLEVLIGL